MDKSDVRRIIMAKAMVDVVYVVVSKVVVLVLSVRIMPNVFSNEGNELISIAIVEVIRDVESVLDEEEVFVLVLTGKA